MVKSLDTLNIFERLKTAELSDKAAKEIAEVLREVIEDRLATKEDLEKAKLEIKADFELKIEQSKVETIKWMIVFGATQAGVIIAAMGLMFKFFK
ncbi:MAG: CCDC90 family protein [Candidatus Magnetominusculus sp. LBB02]|nr:CCDC90 family protein [Candidatus Magnetominusculus sp. LBB02]